MMSTISPGSLRAADFRGQDARCEERFEASRTIEILPVKARSDWSFLTGKLLDCSCSGMGLIVTGCLMPGEQFLVKLKLDRTVRLLIYTVRHRTPVTPGCPGDGKRPNCPGCRIGAEFTGLAAEQLWREPQTVLAALLESDAQAEQPT